MALKKTHKSVQETLVEEPTEDLDVPSETIREEEQEDFEEQKTRRTAMIMKLKRNNQPKPFHSRTIGGPTQNE
jgi:hypothetical protein